MGIDEQVSSMASGPKGALERRDTIAFNMAFRPGSTCPSSTHVTHKVSCSSSPSKHSTRGNVCSQTSLGEDASYRVDQK
uniref:Uncharacterized protein n=1 Tax=Tanacetum cinerariifolium TaxID=118510 RepID=A0A699WS64_TANCI|nr:hypothetical protein [Tanacetum cinerariifolium]